MIAYFDTSAFVKLVVPELGSDEALALWTAAERVVSSRVLYPEARSALGRAWRAGRLGESRLPAARSLLEAFWTDLDRVELSAPLARLAGDLAERHQLRGYDAVHLSSAASVADDAVFVAADRELVEAATALGLATARIPQNP